MNYTFHPHAEKELEEIKDRYDSTQDEVGDRFRDEMQMALSRISRFPNAWPPLTETVRHCRLNVFPYEIIYYVMSAEIYILAVMHDRRDPDYWAYRM